MPGEARIIERWEGQTGGGPVPQRIDDERHWAVRYTLHAVFFVVLFFPLFYGGKQDIAQGFVQLLVFASALVLAVYFLFCGGDEDVRKLGFHPPSSGLVACFLCFSSVLVLQLIPLPLAVLKLFSSRTAELYRLAGSSGGHLSIEPVLTLSESFWIAALCILGFWLAVLPRSTVRTTLSSWRSKKTKLRDSLLAEAREVDLVVDVIHRAVILLGTLASIIAIVHWTVRAELLFGISDPARSVESGRAHWPFVDPDHLSVLLEISMVLTFARMLRLGQLRAMRGRREETDNFALRLLQSPTRLGAELPYALALLSMVLCNILTLSRAGNALAVIGLSVLYYYYHRLPVRRPHLLPAGAREGRLRNSFWLRRYPLAKRIAAVASVVLLVLFFLGQTGRDLAAKRIEYGLEAGYDESRQVLARTSLNVFADFPLIGVGLGCWHLAAAKYIPKELAGWRLDFAHNDHLQLLAEVGVLGFAAVLSAVVFFVVMTLRAWNRELIPTRRMELLGTSIALLLPFMHAFVDFPFHIPGIALVVAIVAAAHLRVVRSTYLVAGQGKK